MIGFHVFSGSQILSSEGIIHHLRGGVDLALRTADQLGIVPEIIDLGGGFGVPYAPEDRELDLDVIGAELRSWRGERRRLGWCSSWAVTRSRRPAGI